MTQSSMVFVCNADQGDVACTVKGVKCKWHDWRDDSDDPDDGLTLPSPLPARTGTERRQRVFRRAGTGAKKRSFGALRPLMHEMVRARQDQTIICIIRIIAPIIPLAFHPCDAERSSHP